MAEAITTTTLSMKLLIDTKAQRVLFAEASKEAVDFLHSLLALPVASVVKQVGKEPTASSAANLHASVEKLSHAIAVPGAAKDLPAASTSSSSLLLWLASFFGEQPKTNLLFKCSNSYYSGHGHIRCSSPYVTDVSGTVCPSCCYPMTVALQYVSPAVAGIITSSQIVQGTSTAGGITQGAAVTYTVTDDLTVTPMSAISTITLLNKHAATDPSALQEKNVRLGYSEGLEILKASLQSKTVLTDVFLGKNKAPGRA
ncbi:hypothetical protein ACP70R_030496 [Stipagrostis hirtigluma subsp. patula]